MASEIVDAAYHVHKSLGPGLLESAYEAVLAHELIRRGLAVQRQVGIAIDYEGVRIEEGYRADIIVDGVVIVELKSIEALLPVHKKQLLTYLKLADKKLGLLINFWGNRIKDGIVRPVNGLPE